MGSERPQILSSSSCDVAIIGGGPSGLIAARDLAGKGCQAIVLEEHQHIGAPVHCTGVLGLDAFDELELSRVSILNVLHAARFVGADGSGVEVEAERVRAAIVDRAGFDASLAREASAAGAEIVAGCRVVRIDPRRETVIVHADAGELRARSVIIACGASYRFNRALGFGIPAVLAHSAQLEVPFPSMQHVEVHFGRQFAPGGFAWIVPFNRGSDTFARVGVLCDRNAEANFEAFFARIRQTVDSTMTSPWPAPRLRVLPLAPVARTVADRILVVGDAAGLVKPTTGGGIYYGLLTGRLAAEVLTECLESDSLGARHLGAYERRWRQRLGSEIRAGLAFRSVAARLSDRAIDALIDIARADGIVPLLKQTADFNWHGTAARSVLRHPGFRRAVLGALWS
jgi:digeranylgeranylglycerophospholipid reductase